MAGVAPSPHVADVPRADAELPSRALDPSAEPGGGASAYATPPQVAPPSGTGEGLTADEGALEALPEASPGAPPLRAPEAEPLSHPVRAPDPGSPPELSPDLPLEPRAPRGR